MKRLNTILEFIGCQLLLALALAVFIVLVIILGTGATFLVVFIGEWIGIGKDIFIYIVLFVAYWKAWDALAWVVGKIADREERKKIRNFYEE